MRKEGDALMDENFDHTLEVVDTKNVLYSTIVNRREMLTSISRFVMQMVSFGSFMVCLWLLLTTRDRGYAWGIVAFFALTMANAQILNYRVLLSTIGIGSKEEVDELDDLA